MKKILIAGGGHGGLTAAAFLAEKGYDVEVYEQNAREDMGYDWHDTIKNNTFEYANIDFDKKDIHYRKDHSFFSPSLKAEVEIKDTPESRVDYEIERKVLYNYLIDNATNKGAKIYYNSKVNAPYIQEGKIVGLLIDNKVVYGDLVIDSAGMDSSVLSKIPSSYNIPSSYKEGDVFFAYRAYFDLIEGKEFFNSEKFNIYFLFSGIRGIVWAKTVDGMADVLIGSTLPFDEADAEKIINDIRVVQPAIGNTLLRGGQIKKIPLKSTLSLLVGDNYAVIGDAASMPLPLNGSGITNSIAAGRMLAETIIKIDEKNADYNTAELWPYQVAYYKELGAKMAGICVMKNHLLSFSDKELDFLFESKVLTAKELGPGSEGREIVITFSDALDKLKKGIAHPLSLVKLAKANAVSAKITKHGINIPTQYNEKKVLAWRKKLEKLLK